MLLLLKIYNMIKIYLDEMQLQKKRRLVKKSQSVKSYIIILFKVYLHIILNNMSKNLYVMK